MNDLEQDLKSQDLTTFIKTLYGTYDFRKHQHIQTQRFYFRRGIVELTVKTTISASLILALLSGGPAALVTFVGALLLKTSTLIFNCFKPHIDSENVEQQVANEPRSHLNELPSFKAQWLLDVESNKLNENARDLYDLEIRVALSIIIGFMTYTILSSPLSLSVVLAGMLYTYFLTEQAPKLHLPFLEDEASLTKFFN